MPSIIDRYLVREIGLTVLATLLVLLAIVLSHRLASYLSKAASGLLARDAIFLLLGLQTVYLLVVLMPLAFLLSIMLTLGRLYRDHEMIVLAACGYGPLSMYRAVFLLATLLSLLTAGLSFVVIPVIMELQFDVLAKARKEAEVSMFVPGTFREVLNGRHVVYIGTLDERELRSVFIQSREPDGSLSITTGAQGRQETSEEGVRNIVLDHGYRYRGTPGQGDYDMLRFERATVRVDAAPPAQTWRHRETLPTRQLLNSSDPSHIAELQMRINNPIQILVIALWAPLLARAQPREGRYGRTVAAVLIYAVNFNLVGVGESWLNHGVVGATLGLWWVHGLFLLFSLGLLLHDSFDVRSLRWLFQRAVARIRTA
ncbi:MAG: LPS export ABC transporter permease LptF [Candidatus Competibacteraceae bacterium]|nr:LPS export ABC transporter permease LptF [Candidatus Competibacteraceae bacterium]MBK8753315.1 LPS export ABC transporter permease LptF [Candidatus Competibacteraceae bacterium]